jgi:hypothetical protein
VMLMSLYPLHQTYGQLNNTFMLATERTMLLARIEMITIGVSIPVTYLLIAPRAGWAVPGLALGAFGLAAKYVGLQLLATNILMWRNCAFVGLRPFDFAKHQVGVLLLLGVAGWSTAVFSRALVPGVDVPSILARLTLGAVLFGMTAGGFVWFRPGLVGLDPESLKRLGAEFVARFARMLKR